MAISSIAAKVVPTLAPKSGKKNDPLQQALDDARAPTSEIEQRALRGEQRAAEILKRREAQAALFTPQPKEQPAPPQTVAPKEADKGQALDVIA